jgi:hypothetical protein
MDASEEHETRPGRTSTRTPSPRPKAPPTVGSSCTWTGTELELFRVEIEREIPIFGEMIPGQYFEGLEALEGYRECKSRVVGGC